MQTRVGNPRYPDYDPYYDGTREIAGEGFKSLADPVLITLKRGMMEELGASEEDVANCKIFGAGWNEATESEHNSRPEDLYSSVTPLDVTTSRKSCQPWIGFGYAVEMRRNWEPDPSRADGEAKDWTWWELTSLLDEIEHTPRRFFTLHVPLILKVATHLNGTR